jgi:hypothetical protein
MERVGSISSKPKTAGFILEEHLKGENGQDCNQRSIPIQFISHLEDTHTFSSPALHYPSQQSGRSQRERILGVTLTWLMTRRRFCYVLQLNHLQLIMWNVV